MTSFLALTVLFVQKYSCPYNKKKITQWLEDMKLFLGGKKTIFHSLAVLVRKILFLRLENKIHIFAPLCNILYILYYIII